MPELTLNHPISANRYWRVYRNRVVKSAEARKYQQHVKTTAALQGIDVPLSGPVELRIEYYRAKPVRSFDLDNIQKVIIDALNGIAWVDDQQLTRIYTIAAGYRPGGALIVQWQPA